ncbi:MAG: hypothetical protein HY054_03500 [Proteobacteria bacterium]|nr:hypothetical protein [Pseudomonadota bacterium]
MGLIAVFGAAWVASRKHLGRSAWPGVIFITFLVALQIVAMFMPPAVGQLGVQSGVTILAVYVLVIAVAALVDLRGKTRA